MCGLLLTIHATRDELVHAKFSLKHEVRATSYNDEQNVHTCKFVDEGSKRSVICSL